MIFTGHFDAKIKLWNSTVLKVKKLQKMKKLIQVDTDLKDYSPSTFFMKCIQSHKINPQISTYDVSKLCVGKEYLLQGQKQLVCLSGHEKRVNCIIAMRDTIISGSFDGRIVFWKLKEKNETQKRMNKNGIQIEKVYSDKRMQSVNCLFFYKQKYLISGDDNSKIFVWDLKTDKICKVLEGHTGFVHDIIGISSNRIASCSEDQTIRIWNFETGKCDIKLQGHTKGIIRLLHLPKTKRICSCSLDGNIIVWNCKSFEKELILKTDSNTSVRSIVAMPNTSEKIIISSSNDGSLKVWNIETGKLKQVSFAHQKVCHSLSVLNGKIVSGGYDKIMNIWSCANSKLELENSIKIKGKGGIRSVATLEDSTSKLFNCFNVQ